MNIILQNLSRGREMVACKRTLTAMKVPNTYTHLPSVIKACAFTVGESDREHLCKDTGADFPEDTAGKERKPWV